MKKPTLEHLSDRLKGFVPILLTLGGIFLLSRLYEWGIIIYYHGSELLESSYIIQGLLYDLSAAFVLSFPLWLIYRAFKKIAPNIATPCIAAGITLAGISNILLSTYFSATLVPLGPEFWAYSFSEMGETIIAANYLTAWSIILLLLFTVLLYVGSYKLFTFVKSKGSHIMYLGWAIACIALIGLFANPVITGGSPYAYKANKLTYFLKQSINGSDIFQSTSYTLDHVNQEYPFLHKAEQKNVLGPYFKTTNTPPNIVFLMVESLGGEFVGNSGQWTGFAPFIDSLAQDGLYWPNGLSLSGRTFGLAPSLLGSLPPVKNGFMDLGPAYPNHNTIISLLNKAGYYTSFFSGYDTYFDNLEYFLTYQETDFVLNKQLIEEKYVSSPKDDTNYWGIDDKMMFDIASSILDTLSYSQRLEIYHTLQNHSPFTVPQPEKYKQKFDQRLQHLDLSQSQKEKYERYEAELTTLLYTDEAIQKFIADYRKRDEYERTIFIITGDHWLIPIPQTTQISRYHVPIIIYSPLLKKSIQFKSVNTHANVVPSITAYLNQFSSITMPESVHWLGAELDTSHTFRNIHSLPLMKNKNQLTDYIHNGFYLADDKLFTLNKDLMLSNTSNQSAHQKLEDSLDRFKTKSQYATTYNKLLPWKGQRVKQSDKYDFIVQYDSVFQQINDQNLTIDEQFERARQYAFDDQYDIARAIAHRILLQYPNYYDVRILMGRTYAWEGNYEQARTIFKTVLEQNPEYYDTYSALSDTEFWSGNYKTALQVVNDGLERHSSQKQLLEKKIRILVQLDRKNAARQTFATYKTQYPESELLPQLKQLF